MTTPAPRDRDEGPEPVRSLHRKLAQVMYEAESIPKNGTAPAAMGGFKFVQVGDAAKVIRTALAEKNVSMIPSAIEIVGETEHETQSKKVMTTLTVRTTWTLTDGETGETAVIQSLGSGADTGDKAAPKAQSNAMKYALLMGFLLSTGDDPEQTDTSDRQTRRPPPGPAESRTTHVDGLVGKAIAQGKQDFELHQTPEGFALPFRIKEGRLSQIVVAEGEIALALSDVKEQTLNQRITVWGHYTDESYDKAGETITYKVLHAERIATPVGTFPIRQATVHPRRDPEDELMDAVPVAEGQEALFDPAESARLDEMEALGHAERQS